MIDQEYGLNSDLNGITPEFRNNLFSTKEIDLEGKYINIRNLNGILKEILNTLYDYYKGKVLVYIDEQLYPQGSVFEYKGNLYYVLREYTDEEIGFLGYPQDGDIFKLLTPNFTRLIEDVRRAFQDNIDTLDKKYDGLINNLQVEDKNINQRITENTHRFEELLDREIENYAEMNKQFSMIKQVLIEHGIINNQEDNFIAELQNIVKEIISANQRQDTELQAIRDKNDLQDNEFNNLKTDYSSFKANTTRAIENDDLRIKALQDNDNIHENTMNKLRTYHDTLKNSFDRHVDLVTEYNQNNDDNIIDLQTRVGTLEVDDTNNKNVIDNLKSGLDTLTSDFNANVQSQAQNNETQEAEIKDLQKDNTAFHNQASELEKRFSNYQYENDLKVNTHNMNIDELLSTTSDHENKISLLKDRTDVNDTDIDSLKNEDELLRDFLERLEENVGTNNSIIDDIQERYENMKNRSDALNTSVETSVDNWNKDKAKLMDEHSGLNARMDEIDEKMTTGELSKEIHDSLYSTITDEIEKAETRIDGKIADACEDTENDIYSEITGAGKEGEFLQIVFNKQSGRSEIQSSPVINFSKIATSQEQVDALKLEPVGMSTVFNTWYRFSHWWGDENLDNGVHLDTRNAWSYDPSTKMIKSNRNSPVYSAFVSPRKLSNWYLKLLAYGGGDGDNDAVLINLAYMKGEDGHEHTIDLVRAVMGAGNGVYQDSHGMDYYWSIVYDYRLNTQFELANNTYIQPISGGWGTKYCCFSSQRTKTTFKCYTSQIGARTEEVDLKSEISWTLPLSKPSNYSDAMYNNLKIMMENPAQMGVGAHSQNGLFTILDQKYIFDDEKIYDFVSNNIWEYDEPSRLWNSVGKCSDLFDGFVYSRITGDLYYLDNGKVINLNNASSVVNNDDLSEKITQLGTEIEQKDTEVLNTVNAHTDEQVQKLQKKIDDLETRLQDVESKVLKV